MRTLIGLSLCLPLILVGCAQGPGAGDDAGAGTPDTEIGLAHGSITDILEPAPTNVDTREPGEGQVHPRPFHDSPPLIPHGIGDFEPITADANACVDCHFVEEKVEGEATPIPPSHLIDLRNAPDTQGSEVVGARYLCLSCHVPQTDAQALVGNDFGS